MGDLRDAGIGRRAREEVVVLRVVVKEMPTEHGHVAGGRKVAGCRETVRVHEGRAGHAELFRGAVHAPGEGRLRPLDRLADGGRRIVRRLDRGGADQVAQGNGLAGLEAQPRGRLRGRVLGDRDLAVERDLAVLDRLEGDVECHHLGQGGGVEPRVGIVLVQNLAGAGVDDEIGIGCRERKHRHEKKRQHECDEHAGASDALPRTSKHLSHLFPASCPGHWRRDFTDLRHDSTGAAMRKHPNFNVFVADAETVCGGLAYLVARGRATTRSGQAGPDSTAATRSPSAPRSSRLRKRA